MYNNSRVHPKKYTKRRIAKFSGHKGKSFTRFSNFTPFYGFKSRRKSFNFRLAHPRYAKVFLFSKSILRKGLPNRSYFRKKRIFPLRYYALHNRLYSKFRVRINLPRKVFNPNWSAKGKNFAKVNPASSSYRFLPFIGLNHRNFSVKHKYFYKRRSVFNFFKYNLSSVYSKKYKEDRRFHSSTVFYLHLRQTKNNLFFFLKTAAGRLIFTYTNGQTIYKGSRRTTPTAAELAGKQVSKYLGYNHIDRVCLVFDSPMTSIVKSGVHGLSAGLYFSSISAYNFRAHNGIKIKSTRRV